MHINPAVLRLLHEKHGLPATFLFDVYSTDDWTVFLPSSLLACSDSGPLASGQLSRLVKRPHWPVLISISDPVWILDMGEERNPKYHAAAGKRP